MFIFPDRSKNTTSLKSHIHFKKKYFNYKANVLTAKKNLIKKTLPAY
jgi:hypothetical protein